MLLENLKYWGWKQRKTPFLPFPKVGPRNENVPSLYQPCEYVCLLYQPERRSDFLWQYSLEFAFPLIFADNTAKMCVRYTHSPVG